MLFSLCFIMERNRGLGLDDAREEYLLAVWHGEGEGGGLVVVDNLMYFLVSLLNMKKNNKFKCANRTEEKGSRWLSQKFWWSYPIPHALCLNHAPWLLTLDHLRHMKIPRDDLSVLSFSFSSFPRVGNVDPKVHSWACVRVILPLPETQVIIVFLQGRWSRKIMTPSGILFPSLFFLYIYIFTLCFPWLLDFFYLVLI